MTVNESNRKILLHFIELYEKADDKEAFIAMWKSSLSVETKPLTIADAYDSAYGNALIQLDDN